MSDTLRAMLPADKHDVERARALVDLGYPAVQDVLPELLRWLQDMNWPVARVLQPLLAGIGAPLAKDVRSILNSSDDIWKAWVVTHVVAHSDALAELLARELARIASSPTPGERAEGVDVIAAELVARS